MRRDSYPWGFTIVTWGHEGSQLTYEAFRVMGPGLFELFDTCLCADEEDYKNQIANMYQDPEMKCKTRVSSAIMHALDELQPPETEAA